MTSEPRNSRFWQLSPEQQERGLSALNTALFYISLAGFLVFLYDVGFDHQVHSRVFMGGLYKAYVAVVFLLLSARLVLMPKQLSLKKGAILAEYLLVLVLAAGLAFSVFPVSFLGSWRLSESVLQNNYFSFGVILYVFFIEFSKRALNLYQVRFNPAILFVVSFAGLILLGALLLLMPRATVSGISLLDAFFTSASAVCITGLVVVDTGRAFTPFGQTIIIILVQLGGLGVMTFTSFLAMFFQKAASFQNQLFLKDLVNEENLGSTMQTLGKIVGLTLLIEAVGALVIYFTLNPGLFGSQAEQIAFAAFHSVSAFCNAGFSTVPDGIYHPAYRFNYNLHIILALLIILGGLGFPIIFNLFKHLQAIARNRYRQFRYNEMYVHPVRLVNINSKLVIISTAFLLGAGMVLCFVTEYYHTLQEHHGIGKVATAFFASVTPRSGGFNTVNMSELAMPTIMIYMLLMWIGASPGSTGGGIKTTTFAVSVLNTYNIAQGNDRVEIFGREIAPKSVRQAFAVMLLSFLVIGLSTLAVAYFNPDLQFVHITFEVFSAFSTVGLSLGITPELSPGSKLVVMLTMFVGRVGLFTLIASMLSKVNTYHYRYPTESIIIT